MDTGLRERIMNESVYVLLILLLVSLLPCIAFGLLLYIVGWEISLIVLVAVMAVILLAQLYFSIWD